MNEAGMTTKTASEPERFDQRRIVFARAAAGELGPVIQERRTEPSLDPLNRTLLGTSSPNVLTWHLIRAVDGPVNHVQVPVEDPKAMAEKIKGLARFFGADLVGITELDQAYVYSHVGVKHDPSVQKPGEEIHLSHKYAVVVGIEMDHEKMKASPSFIDSAEVGLTYADVAKLVCHLAAYIRELGYPARAHHFRQEEVLQVPLAIKAGLGELGRNGYMLNELYGPRVRLGTVTTDLPLAVDRLVNVGVEEFCAICKKCADNCPSRSIPSGGKEIVRGVEKWAINPDTCLRYWLSKPEQHVSCSLCIAVCPWNKPVSWYHRMGVWSARRSGLARRALLWLDDVMYGRRPRYRVEWLDYVSEREAE
ncbi:MAG: reductive dehalogenase [Chloroflexi bacterium]|nr:reductive dehalogenase [Chloroflexota bacterium]